MTTEEIIAAIDKIRDDAYWSSGYSHEDVLKESLGDIERDLSNLIKELKQ